MTVRAVDGMGQREPQELNERASPGGAPFILPGCREYDYTARSGAAFRLLVSMPDGPPPASGFPVMVLVDGRALFATAVSAAHMQAGRPDVTGVGPCVIVGVAYPGVALFDVERRADDLLPVNGGAGRFLAMIIDEILPWVGRLAPIDGSRRALAGHSYGGLFVLHALMTRPDAFASYVAGSPSIWRAPEEIGAAEARFPERLGNARPRLLMTVGGDEQTPRASDTPQRAERRAMARMHDNAAALAGRLARLPQLASTFAVFSGENHVSVIPAMLSRAVAFAREPVGAGEVVQAPEERKDRSTSPGPCR